MKTTARAILATEQGQATIRGFIANVRESAGPKAHMESELAAQLIEAQDRIAKMERAIVVSLDTAKIHRETIAKVSGMVLDLRKAIEAAPCPDAQCCRDWTDGRDGKKWPRCWKAEALGE